MMFICHQSMRRRTTADERPTVHASIRQFWRMSAPLCMRMRASSMFEIGRSHRYSLDDVILRDPCRADLESEIELRWMTVHG